MAVRLSVRGRSPEKGDSMSRARMSLVVVAGLAAVALTLLAAHDPEPAGATNPGSPADPQDTAAAIRELPLAFERNLGQVAAGADYLARAGRQRVLLDAAGLRLAGGTADAADESGLRARRGPAHASGARIALVGAATDVAAEAGGELPGRVHYLTAGRAVTDVPRYTEVRYRQVYPGIDVTYRGAGRALEIEISLAAGADLAAFGLEVAGAETADLDGGQLLARLGKGQLRIGAPEVVEPTDATASWLRVAGTTFGIGLALPEPGAAAVVRLSISFGEEDDPGWSGLDGAPRLASDADGNTFVAGRVAVDDDSTGGARAGRERAQADHRPAAPEEEARPDLVDLADAFVIQLGPDHETIVNATYFGDRGKDVPLDLTIEATGRVIVVGSTTSEALPGSVSPREGAQRGQDAFVVALAPGGASVEQAKIFGGTGDDSAHGVAIDADGRAWIAGRTTSPDLPTTSDALHPAPLGAADAFVAAFDLAGGLATTHASYLGGSADDVARDIAVDSTGRIVIAGATRSLDFAPQDGSTGAADDGFVVALDPASRAVAWATRLGGAADDEVAAIAIDGSGRVVVAGTSHSANFPLVAPVQPALAAAASGAPGDGFVALLDGDGAGVLFSTFLGGTGDDRARDVAVDAAGRAWVAGITDSSDFPVVGARARSSGGSTDAFVAEIDLVRPELLRSTHVGGAAGDAASGLALLPEGGVLVAGATRSSDLVAARLERSAVGGDAFVARVAATPRALGCPGAFNFDNSSGDNLWQTPANWDTNTVPSGATADVCIDGFNVTLSSGTQTIVTLKVQGAGSLTLTGGTLNISSQADIDTALTVTNGTIGGGGSVNVDGLFTWTGFGTLGGTGSPLPTFTANGGTVIDTANSRSLNRIFVNPAGKTVSWRDGHLTLGVNGAQIDNAGTWIAEHAGDFQLNGAATNRPFNNTGTFRKALPAAGTVGITYMDTQYVDSGTTTVEAGTLNLRTAGTYTGDVTVNAGTQLIYGGGTHNLNAGSTLTAPGDVDVTAGVVNVSGTAAVDVSGDLTLAGGDLNFSNTGTLAIQDFVMTFGNLGGTSPVTINGLFTWNGYGTLGGTGSPYPTFTANGGTLMATTYSRSMNRIFVNPAGKTVSWPEGTLTIGVNGARIDNAGTWIAEHPGDLQLNGAAANRPFNNTGTFRKAAPSSGTVGVTYMDTQYVDSGTTTVEAGTLNLRTAGTYTGDVTVNAGTQLIYGGGTHNLNAGSTLTAPGDVDVAAGAVNVSGTATFDVSGDLTLSGGDLNLSNTGTLAIQDFVMTFGNLGGTTPVTVNGLFSWNGYGTLGGTGSPLPTFTPNGGTVITTTYSRSMNRIFVNPAGKTVSWPEGTLTIGVNGARIDNVGTWVAEHPGDLQLNGAAANRPFNNTGTFRKAAPSTGTVGITHIDTQYVDSGTTTVEAGTLSMRNGGTYTGDVTVNAGTRLIYSTGTHNLNAGSTLTAPGDVEVAAGVVNVSGTATFDVSGDLTLSGGDLNLSNTGTLAIQDFVMTFGNLGGTTPVTVNGLFSWNGYGTLGGTGSPLPTFTPNGGTVITTTYGRSINRIFVNPAGKTVSWPEGTLTIGVNGARIDNAGTWVAEHPGDLQLNGAATNRPFNNTGTFRKAAPSTGTVGITHIDTQYVDSGTTTVEAGTLSMRTAGTYTGDVTVNAGTQLIFGGGTHNLNAGSTLTAPGAVDVTAGVVNVSGTATFDVSGDLTLSGGDLNLSNTGTLAIQDFVMTFGNLGGTTPVTVNGLFSWNGYGALGGTGSPLPTFTPNGGTVITTTYGRSINRIFVNPATKTVSWQDGTLTIGVNGARIDNVGTWVAEHPGDQQLNGAATNRPFNNTGTFRKATPSVGTVGITHIDTQYVDSGTTTVEAGTLSMRTAGTYTGDLTVNAGTRLVYGGGTHNLNAGSTLTAPGDVDVTSGVVNVSGTATFDVSGDLTLSGGDLNLSNTGTLAIQDFVMTFGNLGGTTPVTVNGLFSWNGYGTLGGTGSPLPTFTPNGGTVITTTYGRSINRIFVNPATKTVSWQDGTLTIGVNGAQIDNAGTWSAEHAGDFQLNGAATNRPFNNTGTFRKVTPSAGTVGATYMDTQYVDSGTTTVEAGTLGMRTAGTYTGNVTVNAGTRLIYGGGTHNLNTGSTLTAPGDVDVTAGVVNVSGTASFDVTGDLTLSGGTLNLSSTGALAISDFLLTYGTLGGTSNVTIGGLFSWSGYGSLDGTGTPLPTFTANGGTVIDTVYSHPVNRVFVNPAGRTVSWLDGAMSLSVNGAEIDNAGTWRAEHAGDHAISGAVSRLFNNTGTFLKIVPVSGTVGNTIIDTGMTNAGTVDIQAGTFAPRSAYTQTAGTTLLNGGDISGSVPLNISGGSLKGVGTVTVPTVNLNGGQIEPGLSPGTLQIVGDYVQAIGGTYAVEIGGLTAGTEHDQLTVTDPNQFATGDASLNGTLNVSLVSGFLPTIGDTFTILTADTRTGTFATTNLPDLGCGVGWNIDYQPTSATLEFIATTSANLGVSKADAPDPVAIGDALTYTVIVNNGGPETAANVVLSDTLPPGVTFVSATPTQGSCLQGSGVVTCNLGTLVNAASATVTILVTPGAPGVLTNSASVTSGSCDPVPGNDTDTSDTTVRPACADVDADGFAVCDVSCTPFASDQCGDCSDTEPNCSIDCSDNNGNSTPDCAEICPDVDADGYAVCDGVCALAGGDQCGDCDDTRAASRPGAPELCDGLDNDCANGVPANEADSDSDTYLVCEGDCDDTSAARYPGNPEICDGLDNDCANGVPANEADTDSDTYLVCEGDCDDTSAARYPGNPEICDGLDNDCANGVPANELDADSDTYLVCEGDCDDASAARYPGNPEVCDGLDNDCANGVPANELDADSDTYRVCEGDCDDASAARYPGNPEVCDGLDNDCANGVPANEADADSDTYRVCEGDCDDASAARYPGNPEVCDGLDNDCANGVPANEADADSDTYRVCAGDCDDTSAARYPGNPEVCDGLDNDCANGVPANEADADSDTVLVCEGDCDDTQSNCTTDCSDNNGNSTPDCAEVCPDVDSDSYAVCDGLCTPAGGDQCGDCDDTRAATHPGVTELCDGLDNDCANGVPANEADADGDGALICEGDCDDADDTRFPGNAEACDGLDNDCANGVPANEADADNDTYRICEGDCNDARNDTYPGATELCDGLDNDCAAGVPADEADADADGLRICAGDCDDTESNCSTDCSDNNGNSTPDCAEVCPDVDSDGYAVCDGLCTPVGGDQCGDCDDTSAARHPGNPEICDGLDNDCASGVPANEADADGDGSRVCGGDCADNNAARYPGNAEICDGVDNDCLSGVPANEADADNDTFRICAGDCNDARNDTHPGAIELCDGLDNDCAGGVPANEADADGDGSRVCAGDCADNNAARYPGNPEICDGLDNDCAGGLPANEADADGDTYLVCENDCDDGNAAINPGATETGTAACADSDDNDCDGNVDTADPGCAAAVTTCANLGDQPAGEGVDLDVWTFQGQTGEVVTVTLDASDSRTGHADVLLVDDMGTAVDFLFVDRSDLPNAISATLPATGGYRLAVIEHPSALLLPGRPYRGDYCVTLDGNLGAAQSLAPTSSVEE